MSAVHSIDRPFPFLTSALRVLSTALVLAVWIGCSSSGGGGGARMPCEDRFDTVYHAAQSAVIRLGGTIVQSNRPSGTILGRLEVDVLGFAVELSITLGRLPDSNPRSLEPITVTVRATEPGVSAPQPDRLAELRRLEEQYLKLVGERASCGGLY